MSERKLVGKESQSAGQVDYRDGADPKKGFAEPFLTWNIRPFGQSSADPIKQFVGMRIWKMAVHSGHLLFREETVHVQDESLLF